MTGILEGIRVIEMGHVVVVPSAGAMLADWGAEVIKVEPLTGEMFRGLRRSYGVDRVLKFDGGEVSWTIQLLNRNKKGLAVDLKNESGRDILYKLVKKADVFMSNYELVSLTRLKMDYANLRRLNPKLVYGVVTAYGTVGPNKDERGFDYAAAWARSGAQYMTGEPGSPPPPQRPGLMDRVVGAHVVCGILAALLNREKTGKGQELEFSLYHSGVWSLAEDIQSALVGPTMSKHDRTRVQNPLFNTYRTKEGRWIQLTMLQSDLQWPNFCRAIDRPDLENDPRFNSSEMREQHSEELIRILDDILASKSLEVWEERFKEFKCIYGLVATPAEVVTDPQAVANNFFEEIQHTVAGRMQLVTTPIKFCQNPASIRSPAPEIGQHTEEILLELGYSWDDIMKFKDDGVIN